VLNRNLHANYIGSALIAFWDWWSTKSDTIKHTRKVVSLKWTKDKTGFDIVLLVGGKVGWLSANI